MRKMMQFDEWRAFSGYDANKVYTVVQMVEYELYKARWSLTKNQQLIADHKSDEVDWELNEIYQERKAEAETILAAVYAGRNNVGRE